MACELSQSDVNHLRRLVAWVRCGIPQSPDDLMETVRRIAPAVDPENERHQAALVKMHAESAAVPQYIRAAIKALEGRIKEHEATDGEVITQDRHPTVQP